MDYIGQLSVLTALYTFQGLPIGLVIGSLEVLLTDRLSYYELGLLALAVYPYSLKLLWSPIVDGWYWNFLGRRKTWIVLTMSLEGLLLLWLSPRWRDIGRVQPWECIVAVFLMASQDIAVDGMAVSILPNTHAHLASTCQSIGLTIGKTIAFPILLLAKWQVHSFVRVSGWMFLLFGISFGILFPEHRLTVRGKPLGIISITTLYSNIVKLCKQSGIQLLVVFIWVSLLAFAAIDHVLLVRLLKVGYSKNLVSILSMLFGPLGLIVSLLVGRWIHEQVHLFGRRFSPLSLYMTANAWRLGLIGGIGSLFVWLSSVGGNEGRLSSFFDPYSWWMIFFCSLMLAGNAVLATMSFISLGAFFNRICDPSMGGTYLTFLNTLANLGSTWSEYGCFFIVDKVNSALGIDDNASHHHQQQHQVSSATSDVVLDGFHVLSLMCLLWGVVTFPLFLVKWAKRLGEMRPEEWRTTLDTVDEDADEDEIVVKGV